MMRKSRVTCYAGAKTFTEAVASRSVNYLNSSYPPNKLCLHVCSSLGSTHFWSQAKVAIHQWMWAESIQVGGINTGGEFGLEPSCKQCISQMALYGYNFRMVLHRYRIKNCGTCTVFYPRPLPLPLPLFSTRSSRILIVMNTTMNCPLVTYTSTLRES